MLLLSVHGCTVCCVLDGHGPFGHDICNIVQQDLLRLIIRNPDLPLKSGSVLQEAFLRVSVAVANTASIRFLPETSYCLFRID